VVNFPVGSSLLDTGAREALVEAVVSVNQDPRIGRLEIHGRTDANGDQTTNDRLADARGLAVRNYLRDHGLRSDIDISIHSRGACCYVAGNDTPAGRRANRRVEMRPLPPTPAERRS